MAEFLIELYLARGDRAAAERALRAASRLTRREPPVRLVRSLVVPEDETCFLLVEAATADAVREAARLVGLRSERVTEVVTETCGAHAPF